MNNELYLFSEPSNSPIKSFGEPWKVLVIDDDKGVHVSTNLVLRDFTFDKRPIEIISGYSGNDARTLIQAHPDISVILLDVIMETDSAGLDVVTFIRKELKNEQVRILLRTGQCSEEEDVFDLYDINSFLDKSHLSSRDLKMNLKSALRSYQLIHQIEKTKNAALNANNAKSQFLANMSHELRTPMHGILSYAQMGGKRVDKVPTEKLKQYFENIEISGLRLLKLINNLLDISKLEAGKMELSIAEYDIENIIHNCTNELSAKLEHRHITVINQVTSPVVIECDNTLIHQVIINLLSNAIKHSPVGKEITFHYEIINQQFELSITDQGAGLESNKLDVIFNKFIQDESTETGIGMGSTGLGLAISKEIIEAHKGKIWAESPNAINTGGIFKISMPVSQKISIGINDILCDNKHSG